MVMHFSLTAQASPAAVLMASQNLPRGWARLGAKRIPKDLQVLQVSAGVSDRGFHENSFGDCLLGKNARTGLGPRNLISKRRCCVV